MSRTLDRLAKSGFVTRTPDSAYARRHVTRMTARGRTVLLGGRGTTPSARGCSR